MSQQPDSFAVGRPCCQQRPATACRRVAHRNDFGRRSCLPIVIFDIRSVMHGCEELASVADRFGRSGHEQIVESIVPAVRSDLLRHDFVSMWRTCRRILGLLLYCTLQSVSGGCRGARTRVRCSAEVLKDGSHVQSVPIREVVDLFSSSRLLLRRCILCHNLNLHILSGGVLHCGFSRRCCPVLRTRGGYIGAGIRHPNRCCLTRVSRAFFARLLQDAPAVF